MSDPVAAAPAEPAGGVRLTYTRHPFATAPGGPAGGARLTSTSEPVATAPAVPAGGALFPTKSEPVVAIPIRTTSLSDPLPKLISLGPVLPVASCGPNHEFEFVWWLVTAWAGQVHVIRVGSRARIFSEDSSQSKFSEGI